MTKKVSASPVRERRPRWTRARLAWVLAERFGRSTRTGAVDTRAVAAAMGVSQRTVQRWLHADGRRRAPIPAARLQQLEKALMPNPQHARRQTQQANYAAAAIARLAGDPAAALTAWQKQGWLEEHRVAIVAVPAARVRRVVTSRVGAEPFEGRRRRGGRIVSQARVPTRFHATLLIDLVLRQVGPWRVHLPGPRHAATITWFDDAPAVDLDALVTQLPRQVDGDG